LFARDCELLELGDVNTLLRDLEKFTLVQTEVALASVRRRVELKLVCPVH